MRSGFGIPTAGFPNGSGYVAYKYRLDDGSLERGNPNHYACFSQWLGKRRRTTLM